MHIRKVLRLCQNLWLQLCERILESLLLSVKGYYCIIYIIMNTYLLVCPFLLAVSLYYHILRNYLHHKFTCTEYEKIETLACTFWDHFPDFLGSLDHFPDFLGSLSRLSEITKLS